MPAQKTRTKRRYGLVILSMHRSGSSALAGLLGQMGCDLPEKLMPANRFNEKGYFESLKVYKLNDTILEAGGSRWDDWQAFDPDWITTPAAQEFLTQGQEVLQDEYGTSRLFVLKDPRICRLMPFWQKLFKAQNITPVYIHTHRNPVEVARSLEHREEWPFSYGLLLWLRHVLDSEAQTRGATRLFTSYDRVLSDWSSVVQTIAAKTKITFPKQPDQVSAGINDFLSTDLRHNALSKESVALDPIISDWVRQVFDIFETWADTGELKADHKRLDAVRAQFDTAAPMFGAVIEALRTTQEAEAEARSTAETERDTAQAELDNVRREMATLHEDTRQAQTMLTQCQSERDDITRQAEHLRDRNATLTRDVISLTKESSDRASMNRSERFQLHQYLKGLERDSAAQNRALQTAKTHLAAANKELHESALEHETLIKQNTRKTETLAALRTEKAMLVNSTSWKLTAPLRRLIMLIKG